MILTIQWNPQLMMSGLNLWAIITVLVFGTILLVLVYFGIAALRV